MSALPPGAVIWRGPSQFDGESIVVVAHGLRGTTKNAKTGPKVHLSILTADVEPRIAEGDGRDEAVCGDCPLRPLRRWTLPTCMSGTGRRRSGTGGNVTAGTPSSTLGWLQHALIRFGAYGDPAAVPLEVWRPILDLASGWTGYTHQWRRLDPARWGWLMASCDTVEDRLEAKAAGWRTFRVRAPDAELFDGETVCPSC